MFNKIATSRFILLLSFFVISFFLAPLQTSTKDGKFYLAGLAVSDTNIGEQWHLEKIRADAAWEKTQGSDDIVVAVIDTGIDLNHPDLANNIWVNSKEIPNNGVDDDNNGYVDDVRGWDFVENDNSPEPNLKNKQNNAVIHHGTAVAGIIAAEGNNAFAGSGVAWRAKIMPLKIFDETGESNILLVGAAIEYAIKQKADIINMSFVGLVYSEFLEQKIKAAYQAGILLIAAAGKENGAEKPADLDKSRLYPICHDGAGGENWILGVAATDKDDKKTEFSNYGKNCVDISAPGIKINSSLFQDAGDTAFNSYFGGGLSGTSMAAPQVAGAAVLIKALYPNYTNQQLMQALLGSVDNIDGINPDYAGRLGKGRLNVYRAVAYPAISMETEAEQKVKYALAAGAGSEPKIWLLDAKGDVLKEFLAFSKSFRGGINAVIGDIDNDGMAEIVVGAGAGGSPHIRIFNLSGKLKYQFFAFDKKNRHGVIVAIGDTDGDKINEVIAMEANGKNQIIRILNERGDILKNGIKTGLNGLAALAAGDINYDGFAEIIVAGGGKIKVMNGSGAELSGFFPFGKNFYGGVNLAIGDLSGSGWPEIIVSKKKGDTMAATFDYTGRLLSPPVLVYDNKRTGLNISAGDKDGDGRYEIIAAPNIAPGAEIKILDGKLMAIMSFYPLGKNFKQKLNALIITRGY